MPSLILLIGLIAIVYPSAIASAPLFVIGWCMLLYGVVEIINTLKIGKIRRLKEKMAKAMEEKNIKEKEENEKEDKAVNNIES